MIENNAFYSNRLEDKKDKQKLVSHPFPDNASEDKYIYEILTFTGNWASASCDSKVNVDSLLLFMWQEYANIHARKPNIYFGFRPRIFPLFWDVTIIKPRYKEHHRTTFVIALNIYNEGPKKGIFCVIYSREFVKT